MPSPTFSLRTLCPLLILLFLSLALPALAGDSGPQPLRDTRWATGDTLSVTELDTTRFTLPSWYAHLTGTTAWPATLERTWQIDTATGDTLSVRFRALNGRHHLTILEIEP